MSEQVRRFMAIGPMFEPDEIRVGGYVMATDYDALHAENERLRVQVSALQSDANSWQSGYDKGREDGAKAAEGWKGQHARDSAELRKLCAERDALRTELAALKAPAVAGDEREAEQPIRMPARMTCDDGYPSEDSLMANAYNRALDDVIRLNAAPIAQPADGLVEALEHARLFIRNGVELGYIQMPDVDTPDPAHDTLPKIDAALAAHRAQGNEE